MSASTVIRQIGNSQGITIPKALCSELGLVLGTSVDLDSIAGALVVTPRQSNTKRIGVAKGKKLVSEDWYSEVLDAEIAAEFGV